MWDSPLNLIRKRLSECVHLTNNGNNLTINEIKDFNILVSYFCNSKSTLLNSQFCINCIAVKTDGILEVTEDANFSAQPQSTVLPFVLDSMCEILNLSNEDLKEFLNNPPSEKIEYDLSDYFKDLRKEVLTLKEGQAINFSKFASQQSFYHFVSASTPGANDNQAMGG